MLELSLPIAGALGLAAWLVHRRRVRAPAGRAHAVGGLPATGGARGLDLARVDAANELVAERLWRLCYTTRPRAKSSERMNRLVHDNVAAILQVDLLNRDFIPRRPNSMPQLLQALDDEETASEKLSRMISSDPVLTADVLRMANSSLYRTSSTPIVTIRRAVTVCGAEALRTILANAMLRPVFRATSRNFPRLPRLLWARTERAARAAELDALASRPSDRFESSLAVLLNALGPLVVHGAILDVYARNSLLHADAALCVSLTRELAPQMARRIAADWRMSERVVAALGKSVDETLTGSLLTGELLGTLSLLESQRAITPDERIGHLESAGFDPGRVEAALGALGARAPVARA